MNRAFTPHHDDKYSLWLEQWLKDGAQEVQEEEWYYE